MRENNSESSCCPYYNYKNPDLFFPPKCWWIFKQMCQNSTRRLLIHLFQLTATKNILLKNAVMYMNIVFSLCSTFSTCLRWRKKDEEDKDHMERQPSEQWWCLLEIRYFNCIVFSTSKRHTCVHTHTPFLPHNISLLTNYGRT